MAKKKEKIPYKHIEAKLKYQQEALDKATKMLKIKYLDAKKERCIITGKKVKVVLVKISYRKDGFEKKVKMFAIKPADNIRWIGKDKKRRDK